MATEFGYIRVSSTDQNESRQIDAMKEIGIKEANIYIDKQSGKDFNRSRYKAMIRKARKDDVIYVKSIDRLGRDYDEIQKQWNILREKGINIVVLDMQLLDTRQKVDGITGRFIADLVLQVLCYVAHMERDNIRQRQKEGIKAAKDRGVRFGRPQKPLPDNFDEIADLCYNGKISKTEAAKLLQMPRSTFVLKTKTRLITSDLEAAK